MATFTITPGSNGVTIQLTGVGDERGALLDSFDACAHGTCGCPTNEYDKLASMEVDSDGDAITIDLQTRPGEVIDPASISDCLRYTTKAARADSD
ncbi:MAG: hypothetical protein LCH87_02615 [Actinobacteria bacterium]|nr:hypothetical protein [Actinomycetota bacterium]